MAIGAHGLSEITTVLQRWAGASEAERNEVIAALYQELRSIAHAQMAGNRADLVVQPTMIANEAYLRLVRINRMDYRSRSHFFATAARLMRRIMVDYARSRGAAKRSGGARVTLTANIASGEARPVEVLLLDEALAKLEEIDPENASILEARYFGGLTVDEVAAVSDISASTVMRKWRVGISWLREYMEQA